jgi:hypothetical protein
VGRSVSSFMVHHYCGAVLAPHCHLERSFPSAERTAAKARDLVLAAFLQNRRKVPRLSMIFGFTSNQAPLEMTGWEENQSAARSLHFGFMVSISHIFSSLTKHRVPGLRMIFASLKSCFARDDRIMDGWKECGCDMRHKISTVLPIWKSA